MSRVVIGPRSGLGGVKRANPPTASELVAPVAPEPPPPPPPAPPAKRGRGRPPGPRGVASNMGAVEALVRAARADLRAPPPKWPRALAGLVQDRLLSHLRWLPVQDRYLRSTSPRRLLRTGNQLGKTTAALADLAWSAMGTHPWRSAGQASAGEYWVICASWSQSVAIQAKLHALLPRDKLHPHTGFDPVKGYTAKNPAVRVRHASGGWSVIRFKTTQQGSLDLAGATIDGALFDEPPASEGVFSEVLKRVQARAGWLAIAMTPIGAPVEWVRELAESGALEDIHTRLTPEALTPIGARTTRRLPDGTPCDAAWVERITRETPAHEVEVRIHGGWEIRLVDRYFSAFKSTGEGAHVHDKIPTADVELRLGVDHGHRPGKQCAVLVATWLEPSGPEGEPTLRAYVLDEYTDRLGQSTPAGDARGILAMLHRNRLTWRDLTLANGDRVHMPGKGEQKSNRDLQAQVAKLLKLPPDAVVPALRTIKRGEGRGKRGAGAGSMTVGSRWLYNLMLTPGAFGVHPRCTRLIEGLDRYTLADDDYKDPVDALRYALDDLVFGLQRRGGVAPDVVVR